MMVKKEEKVKKKKKVIIEALKRRLEIDVYSKITVQDIADEAGFSKGGILHYFSTKEDIYLELIEDIFNEFENAHRSIFEWGDESESIAPISALVSVENFILDKKNIKIIINLILYAFQEEKIMKIIKQFFHRHRMFYFSIIPGKEGDDRARRKSDLAPKYLARIAQTVVFFIGLMESIDPIDIDHVELVKYVTTLLKGPPASIEK
ncbi:TetR/AcrR family transcriptional regulator [Spirochaetota bacterium]